MEASLAWRLTAQFLQKNVIYEVLVVIVIVIVIVIVTVIYEVLVVIEQLGWVFSVLLI